MRRNLAEIDIVCAAFGDARMVNTSRHGIAAATREKMTFHNKQNEAESERVKRAGRNNSER